MIKFEDPWQFDIQKEVDNIKVNYLRLMELSQGGPEIGSIMINNKEIEKFKFGGPLIFQDKFIYVPIYIKKLFYSGFKIAIINVETFNIVQLGKIKDLIFLEKIEKNKVIYYENRNKTIKKYYDLN
ncbi:hypothetical protein [Polaribacter porphyrae]|uniref:Uncharacterized protein n=1 Tax=Polaribacter porphyrae TaxID=1137780 RepID=A0A2S7WMC7_9FLAO|nr:hypothetical protein [Polaribacter porphyrae]PQJ78758.1 hypothetical protein BTO18_05970 [Polaribacter porphyrae]